MSQSFARYKDRRSHSSGYQVKKDCGCLGCLVSYILHVQCRAKSGGKCVLLSGHGIDGYCPTKKTFIGVLSNM